MRGRVGKQTSERNPLGYTVSTAYPTLGASWQRLNSLSTTDARGNTTAYTYERLTQPGATPAQIAEPLGRTTDLGLDGKGNLRTLNIGGDATSYGYDGQGRKIRETNGLGQSTTYAYDANVGERSVGNAGTARSGGVKSPSRHLCDRTIGQ